MRSRRGRLVQRGQQPPWAAMWGRCSCGAECWVDIHANPHPGHKSSKVHKGRVAAQNYVPPHLAARAAAAGDHEIAALAGLLQLSRQLRRLRHARATRPRSVPASAPLAINWAVVRLSMPAAVFAELPEAVRSALDAFWVNLFLQGRGEAAPFVSKPLAADEAHHIRGILKGVDGWAEQDLTSRYAYGWTSAPDASDDNATVTVARREDGARIAAVPGAGVGSQLGRYRAAGYSWERIPSPPAPPDALARARMLAAIKYSVQGALGEPAAELHQGSSQGPAPAAASSARLSADDARRIEREVSASGRAQEGDRAARIVWHPEAATRRLDPSARQFTVELTEGGQRSYPALDRGPMNLSEARSAAVSLLAGRTTPQSTEVMS